ncbi:Threonine/homoserine/homoserine lactone efflux protein [Paenibacillus sophorae]|uniref:LysE family translocator n=1 Tax=Paenibacillus sophorae TaxID=1333845 RepID=A0A1H8SRD1_9BACL|nr:LysE family translocator [Paenibacillus sophorae]QWU15527.1 LysE family translocator [Paenibacillus sophorae]SEO81066.1 Threonine/homoserine/homoserine lactone efflux protein [Paenibacillus sophorae]
MEIFIGYIILGLSLSAPIGPINAAQLDKGIRSGFWHAWFVGLGAICADILYMLLVYLGVIHLLDSPYIKTFLWLFGFLVLTYTGIESIKDAGHVSFSGSRREDNRLSKSLLSGFLMSLFNPLSILFWLGIYGSVLAKAAEEYPTQQLLLYSSGIVLGILLWDISMAGAASFFRKLLTNRVLKCLSVLSGLSLVGFGLYFGLEAARLLFLH